MVERTGVELAPEAGSGWYRQPDVVIPLSLAA
jgi:hypothetical protein